MKYLAVEPNPQCVRCFLHNEGVNADANVAVKLLRELVGQRNGDGLFAARRFLKIDIEGSEELFLNAYPELISRTSHLIIEIHGDFCDADQCRKMIEMAGLTKVRSEPVGAHYFLEVYRRLENC